MTKERILRRFNIAALLCALFTCLSLIAHVACVFAPGYAALTNILDVMFFCAACMAFGYMVACYRRLRDIAQPE